MTVKHPFEYQIYLKRFGKPEVKIEHEMKTDFVIDDKVIAGKIILEKNSKSLDDDFTNVIVYELDDFDSDVFFEGTPIDTIQKEFPDKKFSVEERLKKYLMFKDEILVHDEDY